MRVTELRRVDLNLLLAFAVLVRESSVSRAADLLLVTQPGMSAMLSRLRALFEDDVLVRVGRSLEPTPRALELLVSVETALAGFERALLDRPSFEPAKAKGTVTLGMSDSFEMVFLPGIEARLRGEAPGLRVAVRPADYTSAGSLLDASTIDLAVGGLGRNAGRHERRRIGDQGFACIWSPRQLALEAPVGLDEYCAHPHLLVSFRNDFGGLVDDALAPIGRKRRVVLSIPRFASLPYLLEEVPAIATCPALVAQQFARNFRLSVSALPMALTVEPIELVWRVRDRADPRHIWLREMVASSMLTTLLTLRPQTGQSQVTTKARRTSPVGSAATARRSASR